MPRAPARVTQADIARAIRAAQQTGAGVVEVKPDGTIVIPVSPSTVAHFPSASGIPLDAREDVRL